MNTVSANSNLELIHFVRDALRTLGVASRLTFNADKTKANLFATLGEGKPAGVILSATPTLCRGTARTGQSIPCPPRCRTGACMAAGRPT